MGMLNLDITKRSDAARKSSRRAEMKLMQEMNKAGGIEDEMRYQMSLLKRKQTVLQKELHTLRFESKQSSRSGSGGYGLNSKSSEDLFSMREKDKLSHRRNSDYGKNFFGYLSTPGSKKVIKKSTRELDKSLDAYCKKIDELIHEENIGKKLYEQQKENKSVQDKLDFWMGKNSSRNQVVPSHSFFPRLLGSSSSSRKFSDSDIHGKPRSAEENPLEITKFPSQDLAKPSSTTFDLEVLAQKEETPPAIRNKPDWLKDTEKPTSAKSTDDKRKRSANHSAKIPSNEMVFDADFYAPDGRIRMAHRMPEFHLAFHQARKARYVRTKEKREFEIQLSVDEIFRPAAKHRPQSQELSR